MHLNYYYLRFVSEELREKLTGWQLVEAYLQNRYECVLAFTNGTKEFFIKLNLYPEFTCLAFPEEFYKSKRGAYAIFNELVGLKIKTIVQHENDRSFHIEFENEFGLMFKLYGSRSNLILFHNQVCVDLLNKNLAVDKEINLTDIHKKPVQDFNHFLSEKEDLRKIYPAFDKDILEQLELRKYQEKDSKGKWEILTTLVEQLNRKVFFVCKAEGKVRLSFFIVGEKLTESSSSLSIANEYERLAGHLFYFYKEQKDALEELSQKRKKVNAYIRTVEQKLLEFDQQIKYDELANIIMANLHQIPPRSEQVELFNFYTEKQIIIKLKKDLSPQKNAENYYRKAKNQKLEIEELIKNLTAKKMQEEELSSHLTIIESQTELKALRKYLKDHGLVEERKSPVKTQESLFKRFEIEGFEILVGKNAKNNDLLTQKYSFKEDLWLHARDVSGSHVLIKYKAGKKFPKTVIEKAAQLAAYYSKRKTDSLCPVIVTPKKYVRKPKGAPDGQVIVEREEVLLVKPAGYGEW